MPKNFTLRRLWVAWSTGLVLLMNTSPCQAFYWYGWPGSGAPSAPTLLPPTSTTTTSPRNPIIPQQDPPNSSDPNNTGGGTDPNWPNDPNTPQSVPEPTTLVIAVAGLSSVLAIRRWKKTRQSSHP